MGLLATDRVEGNGSMTQSLNDAITKDAMLEDF